MPAGRPTDFKPGDVFWGNYRRMRDALRGMPETDHRAKLDIFHAFRAYGLHAPVVLMLRGIADARA